MATKTLGMNESLYNYYLNITVNESPSQKALREKTQLLPEYYMQIAPEQGQFLAFLVRLLNVKTIIEIGTFTGYSALSMAQALPEQGKIVCCEINETWPRIGKAYWKEAGVDNKIDLRIAPALETLEEFIQTKEYNNVDLIFIDADKINYPEYVEKALALIRKGGVILIDNLFWDGKVADNQYQDNDTRVLRQVNESLANDPRVFYSVLPIGDGLGLALRT